MYSLVIENEQGLNKKNMLCFKITNVELWDLTSYLYLGCIIILVSTLFYSELMSRDCIKWTYNIKHHSEGNAKIASNWNKCSWCLFSVRVAPCPF